MKQRTKHPGDVLPPTVSAGIPVVPGTLATCNAGTWVEKPAVTGPVEPQQGLNLRRHRAHLRLSVTPDIHATINCTEIAKNSAGEAAKDRATSCSSSTGASGARATHAGLLRRRRAHLQGRKFSYLGSTSLSGTSVQFTFLRNGGYIGAGDKGAEGFTDNIHSLVTADLNQRLSCIETVTNGDGLSASATSGQLMIPYDPACGIAASVHLYAKLVSPLTARAAGNTSGVVIPLPIQPVCPPPESTDGELEVSPAPPVSNPPTVTEQVNHGSLIVTMGCPSGSGYSTVLQNGKAPVPKVASVAAAKHLTLARQSVKIAPGTHRRIKLTFNSTGRRLLRRQRQITTTLLAIAGTKTTIVAHIRLHR